MSQSLPNNEIKFNGGASISHRDWHKDVKFVKLAGVLRTPDNSDSFCFVECD